VLVSEAPNCKGIKNLMGQNKMAWWHISKGKKKTEAENVTVVSYVLF
jgi:hypothetical protein